MTTTWATAAAGMWDDAASWRQSSPRQIQRRTRIRLRRLLHCPAVRAQTTEAPTVAMALRTSSSRRSKSGPLRWTAPAAAGRFGTASFASSFAGVAVVAAVAEAGRVGRAVEAAEYCTDSASAADVAVVEPIETTAAVAVAVDDAVAGVTEMVIAGSTSMIWTAFAVAIAWQVPCHEWCSRRPGQQHFLLRHQHWHCCCHGQNLRAE